MRKIGQQIGDETYVAQKAAGEAFLAAHGADLVSLPIDQQKQLSAELGKLMAELAGEYASKHLINYIGAVATAPTSGEGLDYPTPAMCMQTDEDGGYLAFWWKTNDEDPLAWIQLGGSADWEHVDSDPSQAPGLNRPLFTLVWQKTSPSVDKPRALWVKVDDGDTDWDHIWPAIFFPGGTQKYLREDGEWQKPPTLEFPGGGTTFLRDDGEWANPDTYLVKVTPEDTAPSTVENTTCAENGIDADVVMRNGRLKRRFTLTPQNPTLISQTWYPSYIQSPFDREPVLFVYGRFATGTEFPKLFDGWTEVQPGRWRAPSLGRASFADAHCDGHMPADGERFVAHTGGSGVPDAQKAKEGIYRVLDCGFHQVPDDSSPTGVRDEVSYPLVERASDASSVEQFVVGEVVPVWDGAFYKDKFLRLTVAPTELGTDPIDFEVLNSYTSSATYPLLTQAQRQSRHAYVGENSDRAATGPVLGRRVLLRSFDSPALGLPSLPAGKYQFAIAAAVDEGFYPIDYAANVRIEVDVAVLHDDGSTDDPHVTGVAPPIRQSGLNVYTCEAQTSAPIATVVTDGLRVSYYACTDGANDQVLYLLWTNVGLDTRVLVPWQTQGATAWTNDHEQLLNRLGVGTDGAAYHLTAAQWSAICREGIADVATVDGVLTASKDQMRVAGTEPFFAIKKARADGSVWADGEQLLVTLTQGRCVASGTVYKGDDQQSHTVTIPPDGWPLRLDSDRPQRFTGRAHIRFRFDFSLSAFEQIGAVSR